MSLTTQQLFDDARTHSAWLPKPVDDALLRQLYDLMKWAPTSANASPARLQFVRSEAGKARLLPLMNEGNRDKTAQAPVTVIVGSSALGSASRVRIRWSGKPLTRASRM